MKKLLLTFALLAGTACANAVEVAAQKVKKAETEIKSLFFISIVRYSSNAI